MNPFQIIATLRKFGNFLVGLFPILAKVGNFFAGKFAGLLALLLSINIIRRACDYLNERAAVKGVKSVFKRFYWRDYSKDKLSLDDLPADSVAILRPIFIVSTLLCLLLPALQLPGPSVPVETFAGYKNSAPIWSVVLWFISATVAWAAILVGTALSNRVAFLAGGIGYAFLFGPIVACAPKSPTNIFIPLTLLLAILIHEQSRALADGHKPTLVQRCGALTIPVILGACSGIYFFAATMIKMPAEVSSLWISLPVGAALGLLISLGAKKLPTIAPVFAFRTICVLVFTNLIILGFRAGLDKAASYLISQAHLTEGYAWPVWYLLAVGIIMKLVKNSDVVAKATADVTGRFLLRPVTMLLTISGIAVVYSEKAVGWFWPGSPLYPISSAAVQIYIWSRAWFWREPIFAFSAPYIGPILVFDLLCMVWLTIRRRFTNIVSARILYLTILAWFVISEYTFEVLSLGRSPSHSIFALMLFSIWLLWLMHTIGLDLSTRTSKLWPSVGRLPIYGGILIFALLEIHSRGAMGDFRVTNELFLIMERGIIDVGLPYFLWVYTRRRVENLPVGVATVFLLFCAGALIALPFNLLDKVSYCGWDWNAFLEMNSALTQKYLATGNMQYEANMPVGWQIARTFIYCLVLAVCPLLCTKLSRSHPQPALVNAFVLVALASGIASFSKGFLDLGLPPAIAVATAPMSLDLLLSQRVLVIYLSAWIPALLLSLSINNNTPAANGRGLLKRTAMYLFAGLTAGAALRVLFFCHEDFLQAAGAMLPLLALYGLAALAMTAKLVATAGGDSQTTDDENTKKNRRDLWVFSAVAAAGLALWFGVSTVTTALSIRDITPLHLKLAVPPDFSQRQDNNNNNDKIIVFTNNHPGADRSYLAIGKVDTEGLDTKNLLVRLIDKASKSGNYPDLKVLNVESWSGRYPGAIACSFSYNLILGPRGGAITSPMTGITVLLPTGNTGTVDFATIYTPPAEQDRRRHQVAWLADQLNALYQSGRRPKDL